MSRTPSYWASSTTVSGLSPPMEALFLSQQRRIQCFLFRQWLRVMKPISPSFWILSMWRERICFSTVLKEIPSRLRPLLSRLRPTSFLWTTSKWQSHCWCVEQRISTRLWSIWVAAVWSGRMALSTRESVWSAKWSPTSPPCWSRFGADSSRTRAIESKRSVILWERELRLLSRFSGTRSIRLAKTWVRWSASPLRLLRFLQWAWRTVERSLFTAWWTKTTLCRGWAWRVSTS